MIPSEEEEEIDWDEDPLDDPFDHSKNDEWLQEIDDGEEDNIENEP